MTVRFTLHADLEVPAGAKALATALDVLDEHVWDLAANHQVSLTNITLGPPTDPGTTGDGQPRQGARP